MSSELQQDELSQGRPRYCPPDRVFETDGGITVSRTVVDASAGIEEKVDNLIDSLNNRRGCIFHSAYEYPGRYARWTMGFQDPPIVLEGWSRQFKLSALNTRGNVLVPSFESALQGSNSILKLGCVEREGMLILEGEIKIPQGRFSEEERSKQSSVFSVIREIIAMWKTETATDPQLGLYGAFGYDLTFQFDPVEFKHARDGTQRDLCLYLPDKILVHDKHSQRAWEISYDFTTKLNESTVGLPRDGTHDEFVGTNQQASSDHTRGEYAESVKKAKEEFKVGNLFEVVLSQTFREPCTAAPSEIFRTLLIKNPSPYMFIINLGSQESLVGASPEMFVRAEQTSIGMRIETCPISGTIKRGTNALEDAERIREILVNRKEESELTMCTDVDRNDKSRICEPGSVQVIGRRQIEKYSKLIHTVDHVEGILRDGFDALDAFLVHTWAVTVTGAPKLWAIQFVERNEKSARCWYGGAVGFIGFDGSLNTGMTLRTIRLKDGIAEIRAGATLLFDSDPDAEEKETELKASAFREAVLSAGKVPSLRKNSFITPLEARIDRCASAGNGKRVVLIDHEDSFVHTLANYVRQTGAMVTTVRHGITSEELVKLSPDLVVMSPGPGNPKHFNCSGTLQMLIDMNIPVFGVCLGLQSMVEHFGGELDVLDYPMHGKPSEITLVAGGSKWGIFDDLDSSFTVARYHSLYGKRDSIEKCGSLSITACLDDGTVMAIEHKTLPMAAVQFHPESILTQPLDGLNIIANALLNLKY